MVMILSSRLGNGVSPRRRDRRWDCWNLVQCSCTLQNVGVFSGLWICPFPQPNIPVETHTCNMILPNDIAIVMRPIRLVLYRDLPPVLSVNQ